MPLRPTRRRAGVFAGHRYYVRRHFLAFVALPSAQSSDRCRVEGEVRSPSSALLRGGFPTKIDYRKKKDTLILASLLE